MEKRDFLFLDEIAFCLDLLTNDLTTIIEEIHEKGQYAFSYEDLEVLNECCMDRLKNAEKHADECGKNLIKAISIFIDSVYSYEVMTLDFTKGYAKDEKNQIYTLRGIDAFVRDELRLDIFHLSNEINRYIAEKKLDIYKDMDSMTTSKELAAASLFADFQFFLTEFEELKRSLNMDMILDINDNIEDDATMTYGAEFYLVRNKKGQILCREKDPRSCFYVEDKSIVDKFKNIPFKEYNKKASVAIVDPVVFEEWKNRIIEEKQVNKSKEKEIIKENKKETTKTVKKETVKKVQKENKKPKKRIKVNFSFLFSWFENIELKDILFSILPTLIMIAYLILLVTGVMDKITFSSSGFDGTLFGYNFELSGLMADWLENTDHGFFSAITLGLIQIILIVVGFVLDLVLHLLFLALAIVWLILIFVFSMCFYYVFPIAIAVWTIINFFRVDDDKKISAGICMAISVICCVSYFLIGMNVL